MNATARAVPAAATLPAETTPVAPRIAARFAALRAARRGGLVTFVMAGDPDYATAEAILDGLPDAGADVVELGMPFSDPMADGPAIQAAGQRALKAGHRMARTLALAERFRARHPDTPLILMGYYNPVHSMGGEAFCRAAAAAGVDGLILVDLPPEEDGALRGIAAAHRLAMIRLATPTTDAVRLPTVLAGATGFIYHVSVLGITGTLSATTDAIRTAVAAIRTQSDLPVVVGFGVKTADQVAAITAVADAAVVGSAIVSRVADNLDASGQAKPGLVSNVLDLVRELAAAARTTTR